MRGRRHRIGVPAGEMPRAVRAFPPHRQMPVAVQRGQRHRAGPGPGTRRPARRHHHRRQRRGCRARPSPSGCPSVTITCRRPTRPRPRGPDSSRPPPTHIVEEALRWLPGGETPWTRCRPPRVPCSANHRRPAGPAGPRVRRRRRGSCSRTTTPTCVNTCSGCCGPATRSTAVADGLTALDEVRASAPDLVISDVMMPGLDGLELVAALAGRSAHRRTCRCCCCRRGRGRRLRSRAWRPARTTIWSSRSPPPNCSRGCGPMWNWPAAQPPRPVARGLIDSLQEAFFLCDEAGTVVEINAAFTDMLGYGPEGLPYRGRVPVVAGEDTEPEAHRQLGEAFGAAHEAEQGKLRGTGHPPGRPPAVGGGHLQRGSGPGHRTAHRRGHAPRHHRRALRRAARGGPGRHGPAALAGQQRAAGAPGCDQRAAAALAGPARAGRHLGRRPRSRR